MRWFLRVSSSDKVYKWISIAAILSSLNYYHYLTNNCISITNVRQRKTKTNRIDLVLICCYSSSCIYNYAFKQADNVVFIFFFIPYFHSTLVKIYFLQEVICILLYFYSNKLRNLSIYWMNKYISTKVVFVDFGHSMLPLGAIIVYHVR